MHLGGTPFTRKQIMLYILGWEKSFTTAIVSQLLWWNDADSGYSLDHLFLTNIAGCFPISILIIKRTCHVTGTNFVCFVFTPLLYIASSMC